MGEPGTTLFLYVCLSLVAALYSTAGHGGASGYLAVFSLFGVMSPETVPVVLVMNVCVASVSFWNFWKARHFNAYVLLPFLVASVPASYIGANISVSRSLFSWILGIALLLAAVRILWHSRHRPALKPPGRLILWTVGIPVGAILGILSGMIGIGGGVFLSPLILLLGWADTKKTAAVASAFIVLNSLSGALGHMGHRSFQFDTAVPLLLVVFVGGFLGSYAGAFRFPPTKLRGTLAAVLVSAGAKLIAMA